MYNTRWIFLIVFFLFSFYGTAVPVGKKTNVSFDKALPEDISNENFPERIDSFDFPNANLLDLVKAIGKLTGINFIVDPGLSGRKISIIAPSAITVAEAYKAFLSALSANGYTVVKSGAFWKIITTEKAHKDNIEVYSGDYFPNTDQLITRIIKLKYINAKDFEASIKWLLSQDNKISTLESSNSIILSDYGSVIERIMKIIYELDVPGSGERIQLIKIEHASAEEIAVILSELLSIKNTSSRRGSSFSKNRKAPRVTLSPNLRKSNSLSGKIQISNIIPDNRTNSLVISANEKGFEKVKKLVKKLDTPVDPSRTGGVYVYNVLYGTAEEVYNTLMGIKPPTNNNRNLPARNFPLPRRRVGGSSTTPLSSQSPLFGNVNIMADSNTNSLIISAKNKYEYERVLSVLRQIDIPRDQVFIQAIIVEMIVDKGDDREFNLAGAIGQLLKKQFGDNYAFKDVLGSSVVGFLDQKIGFNSIQQAGLGPGLILGLPILKLLKGVLGNDDFLNTQELTEQAKDLFPETEDNFAINRQNYINSQNNRLNSSLLNQSLSTAFIPLLRLLKTSSNVNVLSTPQLTTLDNVSAFIEVGENAPVGLSNTATIGAIAQNSVDREDITLRLDITPRINPESGTVQMDIKQKFDDFSNRSSSASELATRGVHIVKRNIETKMVLHDGETAVLGGLLTDKETKSENKVPILGDIPIIGWFFKGAEVRKEKRNLLVFITPTIIKGKDQKRKTKDLLGKKLEERIQFVEKYMKGKDPHGETLDRLIPTAKNVSEKMLEMEEVDGNNTDKDWNINNLFNDTDDEREESDSQDRVDETIKSDIQDELEGKPEEEILTPLDYQEALPPDNWDSSSSEGVTEEEKDDSPDFISIDPDILE
ncbi:MAG: hypothetical protein OXC37_00765 [Bdellovibrionaceae bacterium]|nr:hypothetical protein [Pseudobdellovibrionaceae bacterium]